MIFKYLHISHPTEEQTNVFKSMEYFVSPENQYDFMVLNIINTVLQK